MNANRKYIVNGGPIAPCILKSFPFKSTLFYVTVERDEAIHVITINSLNFGLISAVQGPLVSAYGQTGSTIDQNPNNTSTSPSTTPGSTTLAQD